MKSFFFTPFLSFILPLFFLIACNTTTPYKVSTLIGKGEIPKATMMFIDLLNEGEVEDVKLEHLLTAFAASHRYSLKNADDLFEHLNGNARQRILPWYANEYLQKSETAVEQYKFEQARDTWKHYQKIRYKYYPKVTEPTPVLGIIDLREAEFLARNQKYARAKVRFNSARKQLTVKADFDLVHQTVFKRMVKDIKKMLAASDKPRKPFKK